MVEKRKTRSTSAKRGAGRSTHSPLPKDVRFKLEAESGKVIGVESDLRVESAETGANSAADGARSRAVETGGGRSAKTSSPDLDNPEWTEADFAKAKRLRDVFSKDAFTRKPGQRGAQKAPTKVHVSMRVDADVAKHFRIGEDGWRDRLNEALRGVVEQAE